MTHRSDPHLVVPSRRFGRYMVSGRLGSGGMAEVFRAEPELGADRPRAVALKVLREGIGDDAFAAESDLMRMLSHPNLVQLVETGRAFGRPYLSLELMEGGDLASIVAQHRARNVALPIGAAVTATLEVCRGLAYFHQAHSRSGVKLGLVHADVNPANVLFSERGDIKLGDFGVATSIAAAIGPEEGMAAGKLSSLSPEQVRGEALTAASDVWSVGVMLYELCAGVHPFIVPGMTDEAAMAAIAAAKWKEDRVDPALASVLRRAFTTQPSARYQTAGEFAGALIVVAFDNGWYWTTRQVRDWLDGLRSKAA